MFIAHNIPAMSLYCFAKAVFSFDKYFALKPLYKFSIYRLLFSAHGRWSWQKVKTTKSDQRVKTSCSYNSQILSIVKHSGPLLMLPTKCDVREMIWGLSVFANLSCVFQVWIRLFSLEHLLSEVLSHVKIVHREF